MKRIAVVTSSANIVDERISEDNSIDMQIQQAETFFKNIQVEVIYGNLFTGKKDWYAGTKAQRVHEIHKAFLDKDVDAIFSSHGGYNSNELLPLLDYDLIASNWKPFFGLSDTTILLNAMYKKTLMPTFHGYDFIWQIGKSATELSSNILAKFMQTGEYAKIVPGISLTDGTGTGILLGGCLPSFSLLLGTEYNPILLGEDFIFFMEDIGEDYERIVSYLVQIQQTPNFKKYCKGIIVGYFAFCKSSTGIPVDLDMVIRSHFDSLAIPVLKIETIGHVVENNILPIGGMATIQDGKLYIR